jgi:hypothetical protein
VPLALAVDLEAEVDDRSAKSGGVAVFELERLFPDCGYAWIELGSHDEGELAMGLVVEADTVSEDTGHESGLSYGGPAVYLPERGFAW